MFAAIVGWIGYAVGRRETAVTEPRLSEAGTDWRGGAA